MKLKEIMEQKSIKQNELAKKLGISTTSLNNYCNKKTEPNIETLKKFADYFNVSLDYLCDRKWNNQVGYIPEERKNLITQIINLSDEDFNNVVQLLNGYLFAKKDTADALKVFKD